ncbi:MAG: ABC transporter permease subunit, partial [Paracoccaceae bacterium]
MDLLNALVALANYVIIPGLAYGSQLALGALGITLIYGVLRFSNFAHGDTMAFGATLSILGTWWLQSMGISFGVLPTALLALPFRQSRRPSQRPSRRRVRRAPSSPPRWTGALAG